MTFLLLRAEYVKLQEKFKDLETRHNLLLADPRIRGGSDKKSSEDSFAFRILNFVESLYDKLDYSDVDIKLKDGSVVKGQRSDQIWAYFSNQIWWD